MSEKILVVAAATSALVFSILAVALVAVLAYQQSEEIHRIQCGQKSALQDELRTSQAFLKMTPQERTAKYGSLGDYPDAQVRAGIAKDKKNLAPLARLSCS